MNDDTDVAQDGQFADRANPRPQATTELPDTAELELRERLTVLERALEQQRQVLVCAVCALALLGLIVALQARRGRSS